MCMNFIIYIIIVEITFQSCLNKMTAISPLSKHIAVMFEEMNGLENGLLEYGTFTGLD